MTDRIEWPAEVLFGVLHAVEGQGLTTDGGNPHGWRCEHPDRYPDYCTCPEEMARAVMAAFDRWHAAEIAAAEKRGARRVAAALAEYGWSQLTVEHGITAEDYPDELPGAVTDWIKDYTDDELGGHHD